MTTAAEIQARIDKLYVNLGRLDGIINGPASGAGSETTVDSGTVKSLSKLISDSEDMLDSLLSFTMRGNWSTGIAYDLMDVVSTGGVVYVATAAHTSGTFATDLAAGNWAIYQGVTINGVETLSNKTFFGVQKMATNEQRFGITSDDEPMGLVEGIVHIKNLGHAGVGLLVESYWEGTEAEPFQNHDNGLMVTYNKTLETSFNKSWGWSINNAHHDVPAGVTEQGERIGSLSWATVVDLPGYRMAGTIDNMFGAQGAVGFQGGGTPATAVINAATAMRGLVYADAPGATINRATAVVGVSDGKGLDGTVETASIILENFAFYARAQNGTISNYSFFGEAGKFYNVDPITGGPSEYSQSGASFVSRRGGNSYEFGFADGTGLGSNLGATATLGYPVLVFCGEVEETGDTYLTRGKVGHVIYDNLEGGLIFGTLTNADAGGQTPTECFRISADNNLEIPNADWNGPHFVLGGQHLWIDTTGRLRVKIGEPTSELDGAPLYVPSGTAFPGSPATGDKFYRTDRNIQYFHDGTRWVSTQLYTLGFGEAAPTASAGFHAAIPFRGVYSLWLENWTSLTYRDAAGDWDTELWSRTSAGTVTTIDVRDGGADADATWVSETRTIGAELDPAAMVLRLQATENSGAATLIASASVQYRLIG